MERNTTEREQILNKILDKISSGGLGSLSKMDNTLLSRISNNENLDNLNVESDDNSNEPNAILKFVNALKQSGYEKDFKYIYTSTYTTKGRVTGWFIENDFIAYIECNDKRVDAIYDRLLEKYDYSDFDDIMDVIIDNIETEFGLLYCEDDTIITEMAKKYKLNPIYIEFIFIK